MAAKPLSKTKIVAHIAEKVGTAKKTVATFFEELHKFAVKEAKGSAGKFVIPGIGRVVKAHRKARIGRNPQTGEADQDQGQDGCPFAPGQGAEGCRSEVALSPARENSEIENPRQPAPAGHRGFFFTCQYSRNRAAFVLHRPAYSVFTYAITSLICDASRLSLSPRHQLVAVFDPRLQTSRP